MPKVRFDVAPYWDLALSMARDGGGNSQPEHERTRDHLRDLVAEAASRACRAAGFKGVPGVTLVGPSGRRPINGLVTLPKATNEQRRAVQVALDAMMPV